MTIEIMRAGAPPRARKGARPPSSCTPRGRSGPPPGRRGRRGAAAPSRAPPRAIDQPALLEAAQRLLDQIRVVARPAVRELDREAAAAARRQRRVDLGR